jgi:hypothetical protein
MTRRFALGATLAALVLGVGIGWSYSFVSAKSPGLTTQDYIDIQNLYNTYTRYCDMGGDGDGSEYASLFTPDGEFNTAKGPEALKKMVKGFHNRLQKEGWSSRHTYTGLVITPTPEGAKGSVYLLTFNVTAKPPFVDHSGVYEDWLVKTKDGWKWKKRIYRPSETFKPAMRQGMDELFTQSR